MMALLAVASAAAAAGLLLRGPFPLPSPLPDAGFSAAPDRTTPVTEGLLQRWRGLWAALAGLGAFALLGGAAGFILGAGAASGVWILAGRAEPAEVRRRRAEVARDLPHVVALLASALGSGAAPAAAIGMVCRALPGAAARELEPVAARLELGTDPGQVWAEVAADEALGPLGRTMARSHASGAPVTEAIERLAEELAERALAEVEDRARAVGVRAAVPLGLCFLPAFLLLGIVPLVAGLVSTLRL